MTTEPRTLPAVIWFGMDEMRNDGNSLGFKDFRPNPAAPEPAQQEVVEVEVPKELTPPAPEEIHPSAQASSDSPELSPENPTSNETPVTESQTETKTEETPTTTHPDLDF